MPVVFQVRVMSHKSCRLCQGLMFVLGIFGDDRNETAVFHITILLQSSPNLSSTNIKP